MWKLPVGSDQLVVRVLFDGDLLVHEAEVDPLVLTQEPGGDVESYRQRVQDTHEDQRVVAVDPVGAVGQPLVQIEADESSAVPRMSAASLPGTF